MYKQHNSCMNMLSNAPVPDRGPSVDGGRRDQHCELYHAVTAANWQPRLGCILTHLVAVSIMLMCHCSAGISS
jgi:hypothetical protein